MAPLSISMMRRPAGPVFPMIGLRFDLGPHGWAFPMLVPRHQSSPGANRPRLFPGPGIRAGCDLTTKFERAEGASAGKEMEIPQ
jgi:hypothetical protein